ncbi:60S ribosomal protein L28 [Plecturocebus cupreus]
MVRRSCSGFLIKRNKHTCSNEPSNLKARNSFRYNRLIRRQTVGVEPQPMAKTSWWSRRGDQASGRLPPPTCGPPSARMLAPSKIRENKYPPPACAWLPVARASAILRSQKPVVVKIRPTKSS